MGNPYLKSTNIYDIDFFVGYKIVQIIVNYQYYRNYLSMTFLTDENHGAITLLKFMNFPKFQYFNSSIVFSPTISFWKSQLLIGVTKNNLEIPYLNSFYRYNKPYLNFKFNNTIQLLYNIVLDINAIYNMSGSSSGMEYKSHGRLDFGIRKTFLNNTLNITLNISDPFNWYTIKDETYYNNILRTRVSTFDTKNISITLKWNFNNYKNKYKGDSSIENEKYRLYN
jgi:hypothetical protein